MIAQPLKDTLEATHYLSGGLPAAKTVFLREPSRPAPRYGTLRPDAWWRSGPARGFNGALGVADLTVLFKFAEGADAAVAAWQRDAWNLGSAPLLWVVSRDGTDIYNGFGRPGRRGEKRANLLRSFGHADKDLAELDAFAGRLAMETGRFWAQTTAVTREGGVDKELLRDLGALEAGLVGSGLDRPEAQGLIGRTIFAKYLVDRGVVTAERLRAVCGHRDLPEMLQDPEATTRFFHWLREQFNGDMFPEVMGAAPDASHLRRVALFLGGGESDGQMSLFPYRFDVIPVELISSIYERFVHSASPRGAGSEQQSAKARGVYYTPLTAVSMVLDEVFDGLGGDETVIDLTCGSGVFLVEALRRLVRLKAKGAKPTREMIRQALYEQVYGIDQSEAAIRIAAFSLYLAALELDPDLGDSKSRRFKPLVGRTLLAGDAHRIEETEAGRRELAGNGGLKKFDVVLGNPPWTYRGQAGTAARSEPKAGVSRSPRGPSLDFIRRGMDFAHDRTRFGVLVSAAHFFARSKPGLHAAREVVRELRPVTLINLSGLSHWLFDKADMPAMALLARHRKGGSGPMELVNVPRSVEGDRSRTIGATPVDVIKLRHSSWRRNRDLLKAGLVGGEHDLLLMERIWKRRGSLGEQLEAMGAKLTAGMTLGNQRNQRNDARHLEGLPALAVGDTRQFSIPVDLPAFGGGQAERPRKRDTYRAPLLLVKKSITGRTGGLRAGRPVAGVSEKDLVYRDACYGASFRGCSVDIAYLAAGILGSALASWYFLKSASSFGVWKRIVSLADVKALPAPDLQGAVEADTGKRIVKLVRRFHARPPRDEDWNALDNAVFDLYELRGHERIVASDGRLRATWQWKAGRDACEEMAGEDDLRAYAAAFLLSMDKWFWAANERSLRAEIYDNGRDEPLRVVRFVMEDRPPPSRIVVRRHASLKQLLGALEAGLGFSFAHELVGGRDVTVHSPREIVTVKPAVRRRWLGVTGLDDARAVLQKSLEGGSA